MQNLLITALIYSCFTTTIYFALHKFKVIEYLQLLGNDLIHELVSCAFCCCFWIMMVLSVIHTTCLQDPTFLIMPLIGAPIARHLL